MVKKNKVRKSIKVVISGKEDAQKPVIKRPAVEMLDIAAPITKPVTIPPSVVTTFAPIQPPTEEPIIDTTEDRLSSILKEEKIRPPETQSNFLKNMALVLVSLVIIFWVTVLLLSVQVHSGPYLVERNVSMIRNVPVNLTFDDNILKQNVDRDISVQGMLRKEVVQTSSISKSTINYVVDDNGNKITAVIKLSQKSDYDKLFTNNTKVRTTYNVTGLYRISLGDYILEVSSIEPYSRKLVEVTDWKMENVTIPDKKGITLDISKGWGKINSFI